MPHDQTVAPKAFRFLSDRCSLDLLATVGARGAGGNIEKLQTPTDLKRWFAEAGVLTRGFADEPPGRAIDISLEQLEEARRLREAIFRLVGSRLSGARESGEDLDRINEAAAQPPPVPSLERHPNGLTRSPSPAADGAFRSCLAAVACDAVELLASPNIDRVKYCANPDCRAVFLDLSRPGHRRWCSMGDGGCGNRAKTVAIRQRRRAGDG